MKVIRHEIVGVWPFRREWVRLEWSNGEDYTDLWRPYGLLGPLTHKNFRWRDGREISTEATVDIDDQANREPARKRRWRRNVPPWQKQPHPVDATGPYR